MRFSKLKRKVIILVLSLGFVTAGFLILNNKFDLKAGHIAGFPLLILNKFCDNPASTEQRGCVKFFSYVSANSHATYQSVGGNVDISGTTTIKSNTNDAYSNSIAFKKGVNNGAVGQYNELGYLSFMGHNGTDYKRAAIIMGMSDGAPTANGLPGVLLFGTTPPTGTDWTERMRISSIGEVIITGSTGSYGPLTLKNTAQTTTNYWRVGPDSQNHFIVYNQNSTGMWMANGGTSWNANSDQRLKTNIKALSNQSGLAVIEKLNPVSFNWISTGSPQTIQFGFVAQQVQKVFPELVSTGPDITITHPDGSTQSILKPLGLNYYGFIPPLVKAVQELNQNNLTLSDKLKNQEEQIKTLQKEIEELKRR